jgi:hypothetical protein
VSRPALGSIQPPIQWVPGAISLGVKRPGHPHYPICLNGIVLNLLRTRTLLFY